ncbi:MAG: HAD family hydrolase [Actinomycetota bacterium]
MADRWATFDCYGTLIDWDGGVGDTLSRLWPGEDRDRLLARYHEIEPAVQEGRALPYREVLALTLQRLADEGGLELRPGDEGAFADSLPSWPPFPEVPDSLGALRDRGWKIGILSNTDPDLLGASMEAIGVPVDLRITAAEAGSYKPAPGHWLRFMEMTGVQPSDHVHVGASPFHDIAPCEELGIPAVWINRLGETSELPRAAELPDLAGLANVLDRLVPGVQ